MSDPFSIVFGLNEEQVAHLALSSVGRFYVTGRTELVEICMKIIANKALLELNEEVDIEEMTDEVIRAKVTEMLMAQAVDELSQAGIVEENLDGTFRMTTFGQNFSSSLKGQINSVFSSGVKDEEIDDDDLFGPFG